ncbi:UDP-N-acetylenolpyruvoylglucosamine reductase [Desulfurobacterium thermolithotrophum DSM 11699]|uniref:UDP-N-acetylenolpyruvoylglucosamine reductase n=1 Tax=Desulfurobacterium thermolithotrophum (strain DSM 11699 / BSA) TaxID=868864 RepID=F0S3E5_DESTD|nr:UDP-N-acetylmuramate dehydrogenase [Desulfurobacterium thermolithotrophum]ADY73367.1 UDP-N-acetylenolpyruvoylglucosamine reductase [Desulfurobacterium thermolithotrophum DSM 11699]
MEVKKLPAHVLTTIGIGSVYPVYFPENLEELKSILKSEKVYIIGGGSNTVLPEKIESKIVSLRKFKKIKIKRNSIILGAGVSLSEVLKLQIKENFSLFEIFAGIPRATVGGLVAQNAGAFGREIKDFLEKVVYLDLDSYEVATLKNFSSFSYRKSPFPKKGVVLETEFKIEKDNHVKEKIKKFVFFRLSKQPPFYLQTAGSTFKNPLGDSAGKLLDLVGMKGFKVGGVKFSEIHANFCINEKGSFEEFKKLISIAKERVKEKFNVELELEVKIPR